MIGKRRKKEGGFRGSEVILDQLAGIRRRKRVGLISHGPLLRQNCRVTDDDGSQIGYITSGCPSPTLGCNIAMAYVPNEIENNVNVLVRNKAVTAVLSKMPFVPYKYHRKK